MSALSQKFFYGAFNFYIFSDSQVALSIISMKTYPAVTVFLNDFVTPSLISDSSSC